MKYLMIDTGLCVQPTMEKPVRNKPVDFCSYDENQTFFNDTHRYYDHIKGLPKLPTTCTIPAGQWFEGEEQKQRNYQGRVGWQEVSDLVFNCIDEDERRTIIIPVEQKDENR